MKRLWASALGLSLVWQGADRAWADGNLGISLGRPQTQIEPQPTPRATTADIRLCAPTTDIQLTSYQPGPTSPIKPAGYAAESGSTGFATGSVWGAPTQRMTAGTGGFAAENAPAPRPRGLVQANGPEPTVIPTPPTPLPPAGVDLGSVAGPVCCDDVGCCLGDGWVGHGGNCLYGNAEYLMWWLKSGNAPALVTQGSPAGGGAIGAPGTTVLFGGAGTTAQNTFAGGRYTLGWWCDPAQEHAIEGSFFYLGQEHQQFATGPVGAGVLARPFFSLNTLTEVSKIVAAPGVANGGVAIDAPSRLWGTELNWRWNVSREEMTRLDFLVGARYLNLQEGIHIADVTVPVVGTSLLTSDRFDTENRFAGAQVGLQWECRGSRWSFDVRSKLALGSTQRTVTIQGSQFGGGALLPGGLLALPSNTGQFQQERFSVVPELGFNIGYQCTDNLRFYVGYTLIYWNNVLRPGDQIDRFIDTTQIPNSPQPGVPPAGKFRPTVPLKGTDFFAQGMNFGMEYRY